jgi:tetratricopeptide (TPR) repeat protein
LEALEVYSHTVGKSHPLYASGLNNLAALYYATGDYAQAETLYLEVLDFYRRVFGIGHPDYASILASLILVYEKLGNKVKADEYRNQAQNIGGSG